MNVQLIEADWCIYTSVNRAMIGSDTGLPPICVQAMTTEPVMTYCLMDLQEQTSVKFEQNKQQFSFKKMYLKMSYAKWRPFFLGLSVP